ncbi:alpha/beta fold hydrolase [Francisella salimarina]|uniref:Lipase n=1 Tax=Francisella salimarina TaxID=2599927 RepID=A0AAJ4NQ70_9GAMM|nr:alpha/beta fold hydrolase [Francisella salimarina]QWV00118.1 putative lipase [Francisella salimarina]
MSKDKVVILVHGFIKNSKDMSSLANFLKDGYDEVIAVDLPTTFVSVDVAVNKLCQIVKSIPSSKSLIFVAHSMGGIISCMTIDKLQLTNVEKCVFIASPFAGSRVADFGDRIPFYSRVLKPNKDLKVTDKYLEICNRVADKVSVGLIAGNKYSKLNLLARLCLRSEHDGLVEVSSVFSINSLDRITLNKNHSEIHHDEETLTKVSFFLKTGSFYLKN